MIIGKSICYRKTETVSFIALRWRPVIELLMTSRCFSNYIWWPATLVMSYYKQSHQVHFFIARSPLCACTGTRVKTDRDHKRRQTHITTFIHEHKRGCERTHSYSSATINMIEIITDLHTKSLKDNNNALLKIVYSKTEWKEQITEFLIGNGAKQHKDK